MKAILIKEFGGVDQLYLGQSPKPSIQKNQVLIKVEAAALNRADLLQRKGLYPPPPGTSEILGLEVAGTIVDAHSNHSHLLGNRVMALLSGGGYAEYVAVHKDLTLPIPSSMEVEAAAGIMEAFITGWQALTWIGKLRAKESVLIHAGASGVGTACIQLAKKIGAKDIFTTVSKSKQELCRDLGADYLIDYKSQDFQEVISKNSKNSKNPKNGIDLIIDFIGNPYWEQNLKSLAIDGRMVLLGMLGGMQSAELSLAPVLFKRLNIQGSTLRSRSLEYRSQLVQDFNRNCYSDLKRGKLTPVIDQVTSWKNVKQAHQRMENNQNQGKIILKID